MSSYPPSHLVTDELGTQTWLDSDGNAHRDGGHPAIIWPNGTREWHQHGHLHREDGPAIEFANGGEEWYLRGQLHREDGPAVISETYLGWYQNGQPHRVDGPASEHADGARHWYLKGELHREDGPAREWDNGSRAWFHSGHLHRVDGPAIEHVDGTREWFHWGQRHRVDAPAFINPKGLREWWINGNRLDGHQMLLLEIAQKTTLSDEQAVDLLDQTPALLLPTIRVLLHRNPSEFLTSRVRALVNLAV